MQQVFQIYTNAIGGNGKSFGFCFEYNGDLTALIDELSDKKIVSVSKLRTVDDGKGRRMVTGREHIAIGILAVNTITANVTPHWEPED